MSLRGHLYRPLSLEVGDALSKAAPPVRIGQ
jgi:hypothetical protein